MVRTASDDTVIVIPRASFIFGLTARDFSMKVLKKPKVHFLLAVLFIKMHLLVEQKVPEGTCTDVAKFYGRLRLIHSVFIFRTLFC